MRRCCIQLRSGYRNNKHPRFENNKFPVACMSLLTNPAGLDYGAKLFHDMILQISCIFIWLLFLCSVFCLLFLLYFCFFALLFCFVFCILFVVFVVFLFLNFAFFLLLFICLFFLSFYVRVTV